MVQTVPCPGQTALQKFLLGGSSEAEIQTVETHLASCGQCLKALQTLEADDALVQTMRQAAQLTPCPVQVEELSSRLSRLRGLAGDMTTQAAGTLPPSDTPPPDATQEVYDFLAPPQGSGEIGRLGPYRVLKVLGTGGMGVVFLAEDPQLQRQVALKAMRPGLSASGAARQRFLREARATAAIEHDHIVPIHQVGEDRGVLFIAMPLLRGETLEDRLRSAEALPLAEVVRIAHETASGLAAAHERGLIHRDIKPANLWLESREGEAPAEPLSPGSAGASPSRFGGRIKILDFGLARASTKDSGLTQANVIVGTPAYMAPEQAQGQTVDGRADLFSLGCVLYRLATGQQPFGGTDLTSTLLAVCTQEPRPPRDLNPAVPAHLADLIVSLLQKDPAKRPASARAVIERLDRLTEPPAAKPQAQAGGGRARRLWGWVAAAAILLTGGGVLLQQIIIRIKDRNGQVTEIKPPPDAVIEVEKDGKVTRLEPNPPAPGGAGPLDALRREQIPAYELAMAGDGDPTKAPTELVAVLGDSRLQHWGQARAVAFSPDGQSLASRGARDGVRLWDLKTLRQRFRCGVAVSDSSSIGLAFSPNGKLIASVGRSHTVVLLSDAATGQEVRQLTGHTQPINALAFSPDGTRLASGGNDAIRLSDIDSGKVLLELPGHKALVATVAFSPDGKRLVSASWDNTARIWDLDTGKERHCFQGSAHKIASAAFTPDGRQVVIGHSYSGTLLFCDADTGEERRSLAGVTNAYALAFSPNKKLLAAGGIAHRAQLDLWDAESGVVQRRLQPAGLGIAVNAVAFSPDSGTVALALSDGSVRLLDTATGKPADGERPSADVPTGALAGAAVTPDGKSLISAGKDGAVRLWDLTATPPRARLLYRHTEPIEALALSPDGRWLACGDGEKTIRLWDLTPLTLPSPPSDGGEGRVRGGKEQPVLQTNGGGIAELAFSSDSRTLAAGGGDQFFRVWDVADGRLRFTSERQKSGIVTVAVSPDGKLLATGGPEVRLWDAATDKELRQWQPKSSGGGPRCLAFSPDSKLLVVGWFGTFYLTDAQTGDVQKSWGPSPGHVRSARFSPDGRTLALAGYDGPIRLVDVPTGREQQVSLGPVPLGNSLLAFAPDGRHLITANTNGTIYILRLASAGR